MRIPIYERRVYSFTPGAPGQEPIGYVEFDEAIVVEPLGAALGVDGHAYGACALVRAALGPQRGMTYREAIGQEPGSARAEAVYG
jgi:hypothetical protein